MPRKEFRIYVWLVRDCFVCKELDKPRYINAPPHIKYSTITEIRASPNEFKIHTFFEEPELRRGWDLSFEWIISKLAEFRRNHPEAYQDAIQTLQEIRRKYPA